jgi:hypothetical protein
VLDRFWNAVTAEPWRTATAALAVGLVISLVFNVVGSGIEPQPPGDPTLTDLSTTTTTSNQSTTADAESRSPTTVPRPPPPGGAVVGIKVDNAPGARPQVGIGEASLLVEYPVEGGLTRFTAVFPREASGLVGPIRSLRPVDADLLPAIAPIVVSTGGRPFVLQDVEAAGMNSITAGLSSMFVSLGRSDPHDTFVDLEVVGSILDDSLLPADGGLPSLRTFPRMATVAREIEMPFGSIRFIYQPETGYVRQQGGEPFEVLDHTGANASPLSHDTLVIVFAAERSAGYTDSNGAPVSTFDVIGAGDLLVFSGGEVLAGTWSRSALADGFVFSDEKGEPFGLPEGQTYLAVVSRDSVVTYR